MKPTSASKEISTTRRVSGGGKQILAKGSQSRGRSSSKRYGSNKGVRLVENGVDLTPMPLVLAEEDEGSEAMIIPEDIIDTSALPSNEELSAVEVTFEDELLDDPLPVQLPPKQQIVQHLTESRTETLLIISGSCVARDATDKAFIQARNEAYEQLLAEKISSDRFVDRQAQTHNAAVKERSAAVEPVQTCETGTQATNWDIFDKIHQLSENADALSDQDDTAQLTGINDKSTFTHDNDAPIIQKEVAAALAAPDFLLDVSEAMIPNAKAHAYNQTQSSSMTSLLTTKDKLPQLPGRLRTILPEAERVIIAQGAASILNSRNLAQSLARLERCVQQNCFHKKQLQYRGHTAAADVPFQAELLLQVLQEKEQLASENFFAANTLDPTSSSSSSTHLNSVAANTTDADASVISTSSHKKNDETRDNPSASAAPAQQKSIGLEELWAWSAPLTTGYTVTCMSWNEANSDILAVGYGGLNYAAPEAGLILLWSLRNPEYPERKIMLNSGCTAIHFSKQSPHLLAVGTRDGSVSVFDARRIDEEPLLEAKKHTDPVWQVQWIDKGAERGESVVSISTDGRVLEWSVKKGLEDSTLMILKRPGNAEGVISRQASGLSFDFPIDDPAIYIAGTEDGLAHRCSCSYNEQYLDTYSGHAGPVFKIKCSPFWSPVFLSCSADWTVKLWHQKHTDAIHTFHSLDLSQVVNDIAWSPFTSTLFASVAQDGRIELWDLEQSTLDPIVQHYTTRRKLPSPITAQDSTVAPSPPDERPDTANTDDDLPPVPKLPETDPSDIIPPSATTVLFAKDAPVLVVGDAQGSVTCYRITGLPLETSRTMTPTEDITSSKDTQIAKLRAAIFPDS